MLLQAFVKGLRSAAIIKNVEVKLSENFLFRRTHSEKAYLQNPSMHSFIFIPFSSGKGLGGSDPEDSKYLTFF